MAAPVVIRVHEGSVQRYTLPGGEVSEAVRGVLVNSKRISKELAPVRTARLRENIGHANPAPRGAFKTSGYTYVNIGYGRYVNNGTVGPITSKSGKKMHFRGNRGTGNFVSAASVSGQKPQRFMERGLTEAMVIFRAGG